MTAAVRAMDEPVVGIDLGTTNSAVGVVEAGCTSSVVVSGREAKALVVVVYRELFTLLPNGCSIGTVQRPTMEEVIRLPYKEQGCWNIPR